MLGIPKRCAVFTAHVEPVVAMTFTADDRHIISSSEDGYIYQWEIGASTQTSEYFMRNAICTILCVSPIGTIFSYFDDALHQCHPQKIYHRTSISTTKVREGFNSIIERRLCVFEGMLKAAADKVIDIPFIGITAMCVTEGKALTSGHAREGLFVLGYEDGSMLISQLPLPLRKVQSFKSLNSFLSISSGIHDLPNVGIADEDTSESSFLSLSSIDTQQCKITNDHRGAITALVSSNCGNWLFSGGSDGCLFMYSQNYRAANYAFKTEAGMPESCLIMTELNTLKMLQIDTKTKEQHLASILSESKREIEEIRTQKDEVIESLRNTMHREISKRDKIIIAEREDHLKSISRLHQEVKDAQADGEKKLTELEYEYEKKIAAESLYTFQSNLASLDFFDFFSCFYLVRQAYEEIAEHKRLDMTAALEVAAKREHRLSEEIDFLKREIEKQRELMSEYTEFIRARSDEVITGIEDAHEGRFAELKQLIDEKTENMRQAESRERCELMSYTRQIKALKDELFLKEKRIDELESEVGWAKEKNGRLEEALHSATLEIKERADKNARLEFMAGDQQQAMIDLERVRKTLTTQLFDLRQESGPREELLGSTIAKLHEAEREYEHCLHAMNEKDKQISQKSATILMLQNQNRELRANVAKKDQTLQRAASQFNEYMFALEHAMANSIKKMIHQPDTMAGEKNSRLSHLIVNSEEMSTSMSRLNEILKPYAASASEMEKHFVIQSIVYSMILIPLQEDLKDEEIVEDERERHMQLLNRTVSSLQETMELKGKVASRHILGSIAENMDLITEVNSLRKEVSFQTC